MRKDDASILVWPELQPQILHMILRNANHSANMTMIN